ncbi:GyrI-like domain-containing protein [Halobacteriovorax sp. HLS]|uniref:AraC family transcriptional regulator n=1 Tax=Halobacteriovorax sp. HLS TaxID=2234000 RepID=UPI000FD6C3A1|nr:AraC family transcriptional regulator [Halobacteriovorax sp. HLS]
MEGNVLQEVNPEYIKRIDRVINYIGDNLDQSLSIKELAKIACLSEFHFHRIFGAIKGETLNSFSNRLRLEKAARLLRDSTQSIVDISLECGFSSSSTFSRSFKNNYENSPNDYRKTGKFKNSKICKELFPEHEYIIPMTIEEKEKLFPVEIRKLPEWNTAYIRVSNSYEGDRVLKAFSKIIDWAKKSGVFHNGILFGMSLNDPTITPKNLCTYEVGFACEGDFENNNELSVTRIPSRSYAVTKVNGDIKLVATAWEYLFRNWLIQSKYEPEHAPAFEIFLNKEKALDWSNFKLELCLPVKLIN